MGASVPKLTKEGFRELCVWQMKTCPASSIRVRTTYPFAAAYRPNFSVQVWNETIRSFPLEDYSSDRRPFSYLPGVKDVRIPPRDDIAHTAFTNWSAGLEPPPAGPSAYPQRPPLRSRSNGAFEENSRVRRPSTTPVSRGILAPDGSQLIWGSPPDSVRAFDLCFSAGLSYIV